MSLSSERLPESLRIADSRRVNLDADRPDPIECVERCLFHDAIPTLDHDGPSTSVSVRLHAAPLKRSGINNPWRHAGNTLIAGLSAESPVINTELGKALW
jgi:hypothetical protein